MINYVNVNNGDDDVDETKIILPDNHNNKKILSYYRVGVRGYLMNAEYNTNGQNYVKCHYTKCHYTKCHYTKC